MNDKLIKELAEKSGIELMFDGSYYFEGTVKSLEYFAEEVIKQYKESDEIETFTAYGKKGDWE